MECQTTLEDRIVTYETILDEDEYEEEEEDEEDELCDCEDDFGPPDQADQAYEQWRDEDKRKGEVGA